MFKLLFPSLLVGLLVVSPSKVAVAADEQALQELVQRIHLLEAENAELRSQLKGQSPAADDSVRGAVDQLVDRTSSARQQRLQEYAAELRQQLMAAHRELQFFEESLEDQIHQLEDALNRIEAKTEELKVESSTIATAPAVIQSVVQRIAAAQVENRLRKLESQALVQALKRQHLELDGSLRKKAAIALKKSELMRQRREVEIRHIEQSLAEEKNRPQRQQLALQIKQAKIGLQEAELAEKEAALLLDHGSRELDQRIAEAAIQVAVSEHVAESLSEEMEQLKRSMSAASELDHLESQEGILRRQLLELKSQASEQLRSRKARVLDLESQLQSLASGEAKAAESNEQGR